MAEIVNLRLSRKAQARAAAEAKAAGQRMLHGRTKAEKRRDAAETAKLARMLDGVKRED